VSKLQQLTNAPIMEQLTGYVDYKVFSQYCSYCGCIALKENYSAVRASDYMTDSEFFRIADTTQTDKIKKHDYHHLYGKHLKKWSHRNHGAFLEIGLGCTMVYGPGESGDIWTQMFDHVYFVDNDQRCVSKHSDRITTSGYEVFVGDQADVLFLERMKLQIALDVGSLEVVIDDGGHTNHQIITSFQSIWPSVKVGGAYLIEDFAESAYSGSFDYQPRPTAFGEDLPGSAQYFFRTLLSSLFCDLFKGAVSCYDIKYVECTYNHCIIGK